MSSNGLPPGALISFMFTSLVLLTSPCQLTLPLRRKQDQRLGQRVDGMPPEFDFADVSMTQ
jgi:hypothetical protein